MLHGKRFEKLRRILGTLFCLTLIFSSCGKQQENNVLPDEYDEISIEYSEAQNEKEKISVNNAKDLKQIEEACLQMLEKAEVTSQPMQHPRFTVEFVNAGEVLAQINFDNNNVMSSSFNLGNYSADTSEFFESIKVIFDKYC